MYLWLFYEIILYSHFLLFFSHSTGLCIPLFPPHISFHFPKFISLGNFNSILAISTQILSLDKFWVKSWFWQFQFKSCNLRKYLIIRLISIFSCYTHTTAFQSLISYYILTVNLFLLYHIYIHMICIPALSFFF